MSSIEHSRSLNNERKTIESIRPTLELQPFPGIKLLVFGKPNNYRFLRLENIGTDIFKQVLQDSSCESITKIFAPYPINSKILDFEIDDSGCYPPPSQRKY